MASKKPTISPRVAAFNKHRLSVQAQKSLLSPTSSNELASLSRKSKAEDIYTVQSVLMPLVSSLVSGHTPAYARSAADPGPAATTTTAQNQNDGSLQQCVRASDARR